MNRSVDARGKMCTHRFANSPPRGIRDALYLSTEGKLAEKGTSPRTTRQILSQKACM
jgi:hypothetical protein